MAKKGNKGVLRISQVHSLLIGECTEGFLEEVTFVFGIYCRQISTGGRSRVLSGRGKGRGMILGVEQHDLGWEGCSQHSDRHSSIEAEAVLGA